MQFNIPAEFKNASGVYIIRNSVNSKVYVGSTVNFKRRFYSHLSCLKKNKHHSLKLQRFCAKYGIDALRFELIECIPTDSSLMRECEQKWINAHSSFQHGYNMSATVVEGIDSAARETINCQFCNQPFAALRSAGRRFCSQSCHGKAGGGVLHTPESRAKIATARRGVANPLTPEQRERQRAAARAAGLTRAAEGKIHVLTPEQRERQREAVRKANTGRQVSLEHKEKLSLARRGKKRPEVGAKISAALAARTADKKAQASRNCSASWTPERRAKQAEIMKARRKAAIQ